MTQLGLVGFLSRQVASGASAAGGVRGFSLGQWTGALVAGGGGPRALASGNFGDAGGAVLRAREAVGTAWLTCFRQPHAGYFGGWEAACPPSPPFISVHKGW